MIKLVLMRGSLVVATALLLGVIAVSQCSKRTEIRLTGAGATFPYPLYARWSQSYYEATGVRVNYQSIGSGGGIAQVRAKTVDFGATDAPLTAKELEEAGLVQFPMVVGGVVPVVNLKGVAPGKLRLTLPVLADIYLGQIARWNHPTLAKLNPGVALPDEAITVVHRADSSGTTWIFTSALAEASKGWQERAGVGKAVSWPTGIGGKGNEGVAAYVMRVEGAVGYVELAYAFENKMAWTMLQNRAGRFVEPGIESFQAAAAHADWQGSPGFHVVLTGQPGEESWPIVGATFILIPEKLQDMAKAQALLGFFHWAYQEGDDAAIRMLYVPMPPAVVELVERVWAREVRVGDQPVWPPERAVPQAPRASLRER